MPTRAGESDGIYASSRARCRQPPIWFYGACEEAITLRVSRVGGGSRKVCHTRNRDSVSPVFRVHRSVFMRYLADRAV